MVSPHSLIFYVCSKTPARAQGVAISRCAQSRGPVAATAVPRPDRDYAGGVILQVNIGAIDQLRREHLSLGFRGLRIAPFLTQLSGTGRRAPRCNLYSVITMVMILLPSGCRPAVNFYIEVLVRVPGDESVRQCASLRRSRPRGAA